MKSGWKTSEFWVTALTIGGMVASAATSELSPKYAAIGAAVSASFYAVSRGLAKMFPPQKVAQVVATSSGQNVTVRQRPPKKSSS